MMLNALRRLRRPKGSQDSRYGSLTVFVFQWSFIIRNLFLLVGYIWMLLLPTQNLSRRVWIDENALQPNSVNTHWDWDDVHNADYYLETMEDMHFRNCSKSEFDSFIMRGFHEIGLPARTQRYEYASISQPRSGTNVFAVLSAPRATGAEAVVLMASWHSLSFYQGNVLERNHNFRGIAMLLAIAKQYKEHSFWAKDIIFVISDGHLDGIQAFLGSYHGERIPTDDLIDVGNAVIWAALCIDYPGHSFSELGVFYEGTNGRLPNQDLANSLTIIARYAGQTPVLLYDHNSDEIRARLSGWLPNALSRGDVIDYLVRAIHIFRHAGYQASGRPSGPHGVFHQYRIDAVTLFAVPADGPHGFYALGKTLESSVRTVNNMLERLHASFFFYLLTGPDTFLTIGEYLPSVVLVGIGLELNGLHHWVASGWQFSASSAQWRRRRRPLLTVLSLIAVTHGIGALFGLLISTARFVQMIQSTRWMLPLVAAFFWLVPLVCASKIRSYRVERNIPYLLGALTSCIAGTTICISSVLNFSLAATLAVLSGAVLSLEQLSRPKSTRTPLPLSIARYTFVTAFAPTSLAFYASLYYGVDFVSEAIQQSVWQWHALQVWTIPFVCVVYLPFLLQVSIVALLL